MSTAAKVIGGSLLALLAYELIRESLAREVRAVTPEIFERELRSATFDPEGGLSPLLGTPRISRAVAMIAEQTVLNSLPTIIGRRKAE